MPVAKNIVISIVGLFCFFFLNWDICQYESFVRTAWVQKERRLMPLGLLMGGACDSLRELGDLLYLSFSFPRRQDETCLPQITAVWETERE